MDSQSRKSCRLIEKKLHETDEDAPLNLELFDTENESDHSFTLEQKTELMNSIQEDLEESEFDGIIDIVRSSEPDQLTTGKDKETGNYGAFDLEKLSLSTLIKLEKYVEMCSKNRQNSTNNLDNKDLKKVQWQSNDGSNKRKSTKVSNGSILKKNKSNDQTTYSFNIDYNQHYICPATIKLKSKICYICGLSSKTYRITDHVAISYKRRFGIDLVCQYFTPDTVCGTCRANLSSTKRSGLTRRFRFTSPMIWRPASNHLEPNCDCYFCKVESNIDFFKKKDRSLQPIDTSCSLPEIGKFNLKGFKQESLEYLYSFDNESFVANNLINLNGLDNEVPIINNLNSSNQAPTDQISTNRLKTAKRLTNNVDFEKNTLIERVRELDRKLDLINEKLDRKLDLIDEKVKRDLELIKNQIQNINNNFNISNILMILRNSQSGHSSVANNFITDDQTDQQAQLLQSNLVKFVAESLNSNKD